MSVPYWSEVYMSDVNLMTAALVHQTVKNCIVMSEK